MSIESKFLSKEISAIFWKEGLTLATAESCTAGNVAAAITAVPGSSVFFKGGIIAYCNEVKKNMLGVKPETLDEFGEVSEETVVEMVKGVVKTLNVDCAIATTGIAGPAGGAAEKPVGTIWIAVCMHEKVVTYKLEEDNGRQQNILAATHKALQMLCDLFQNEEKDAE